MPSMDVVSTVDLQVLDNAINNVTREISSRYDFKNVKSEITLDRKGKCIHIVTGDDMKLKAIIQILRGQCARFNVDTRCLDLKEIEPTSLGAVKVDIKIKDGIPRETCQKIVKLIKELKVKVQPTILGDHLRISGNKIDDLQEIMRVLMEQDYDLTLHFVNMK
jgi:cyclic-di-GMP-binding protein